MASLPPSPFLDPAACDAVAGAAAATPHSSPGGAAADLWARGEALLEEIHAYLAAPAVSARYSEATAGPPCCYNCGYREPCDEDCPNSRFELDAERLMAELDEPPLFLRSA
jgi:hypothetical protein